MKSDDCPMLKLIALFAVTCAAMTRSVMVLHALHAAQPPGEEVPGFGLALCLIMVNGGLSISLIGVYFEIGRAHV